MATKIDDGKFDFDEFQVAEEGWHILRIKDPSAVLKDGGLKIKVLMRVEGGASDGAGHFENASSKKNDGTDNPIGIQRINALIVKSGAAKSGQFTNSTQFETPKFVEQFGKMLTDRLIGAYLRPEPYQNKMSTKALKYRTVKEVQEEMKKGSASSITGQTSEQPKAETEGWD